MSDNIATPPSARSEPATVAQALEGVEPMGDLSRFVVADLTPAEEDEFFRILEGA